MNGKAVEPIDTTDAPPGALGPEDRVQGTAIDFGEFRVTKYRRENQSILEFSGVASSTLCRELERLAAQGRGDVGIDLSKLQGLTPALVPALERVRKRLTGLHRGLFLCDPPEKLLDLLTLGGVADRYDIVDSSRPLAPVRALAPSQADPSRSHAVAPSAAAAAAGAALTTVVVEEEHRKAEAARKDIAFFDRSLKRTEILERGLDSAARCVQKMLPRRPPVIPGYAFAFAYRQSEKVGGDLFDFIPLPHGQLGVSVGDMSGRGLEAAIQMCLAKKVIALRARDLARHGPVSPRDVLNQVNDDLRGDLDRTAFITALFAVLDPQAGTLRFARAGHEKPIRFAPGTGVDPSSVSSEGPALGVMNGDAFRSKLEERSVELPVGSRLLLFTDGVIDVQNPRGQTFSRLRLLDALRRARSDETAGEILERLFEEVARHASGGPVDDDMTAVVIARE